MEMFAVSFVFLIFLVTIMAIGVILGRKPISGSCGGMAAVGMESACDVCGGDKTKCEKESKEASEVAEKRADLAYDASVK